MRMLVEVGVVSQVQVREMHCGEWKVHGTVPWAEAEKQAKQRVGEPKPATTWTLQSDVAWAATKGDGAAFLLA